MINAKAKKIKLLAVDVDGVFTDGKINMFVEPDGSVNEVKSFYAMDGLGFVLLNEGGLSSAIITGRAHKSTEERAKNIGIKYLYQGYLAKTWPLEDLLAKEQISLEEIAYIGDDLIDLRVLTRVGLACCPANSHEAVKKVCHLVTRSKGGEGAIREVIEIILEAQGKFDGLVSAITAGTWKKKPKSTLQIFTSDGTH